VFGDTLFFATVKITMAIVKRSDDTTGFVVLRDGGSWRGLWPESLAPADACGTARRW
jgi:hypothetical protein